MTSWIRPSAAALFGNTRCRAAGVVRSHLHGTGCVRLFATSNTHGVQLRYLAGLPIDPRASFTSARKRADESDGCLAWCLQANPHTRHLVKEKADVYASYASDGEFGATMAALLDHFKGREDTTFVWMNFACAASFQSDTTTFEDRAEKVRNTMSDIGNVVIVLTPGEAPIATTRSWCCLEWMWISKAKLPVEFCVDPGDAERLIGRMQQPGMELEDFDKCFTRFARYNVEKAKALKAEDQEAVVKLVRATGVLEVNNRIMHRTKAWLKELADQALAEASEGTDARTHVLNSKAAMQDQGGDVDGARSLYELALQNARMVPNGEEAFVTQLYTFAKWLQDQGKRRAAEALYREALEVRLKMFGSDHASVSTARNNLAGVLKTMGKHGEAELLYREVLEVARKVFPSDHPSVASALNNLGSYWTICFPEKCNDAILCHREALEINTKAYGRDHAEVAQTLLLLGRALLAQKKPEEAEPPYREALEIYIHAFGREHAEVGWSLYLLAELLEYQGKVEEAVKLGREAVRILERTLGVYHDTTVAIRKMWG